MKSLYVQIAENNISSSQYSDSGNDDDADEPEPVLLADEIHMKNAGLIMILESSGKIKCLHETDVEENAEAGPLPQDKKQLCKFNMVEAKNRQSEVSVNYGHLLQKIQAYKIV